LFQEDFMRVLYINNLGGGFADFIEVPDGMTVERFFLEQIPHGSPQNFLIRVDRQPVSAGQVLHEGARISITPTKIEGACG
jgi:hypothetical protein